ncbi:MAG TPA: GYD domain-containing protein [Beijerinckiaceae bacterium]|nr:GYD domain-containing protein [Beijerinckiaceae bacterium]
MAIFISQGRYTRDAIQGMTVSPEDRSKPVGKLIKAAGGKLLSYYLTFGEYDFLLVAEAPDEKAMAAAVLAAAGGGGVSDVRTTLALTPGDAMQAFEQARGLGESFRSAGQGAPAGRGQGGMAARAEGRSGARGEGRAAGAPDETDRAAVATRRTRGGRASPT